MKTLSLLLAIALNFSISAATFTVNTVSDAGPGSLRQQITDANATPDADTITFNIGGAGPHTIALASALPMITNTVTIDGYTQSGASANSLTNGNNAVLRIRLDGPNGSPRFDGLVLSASNCVVRGLALVNFDNGIVITQGTGNLVAGCFIGIDTDGLTMRSNRVDGVRITSTNTAANVIGGTMPAARNLISGNGLVGGYGVRIDTSPANRVEGNFIGTDASGTAARGNRFGAIFILNTGPVQSGVSNIIGGTLPGARNLVSGNAFSGIAITATHSNSVLGNFIGTDVSGTQQLGNSGAGVAIVGNGNVIGGAAVGAGNLISANAGRGVHLESGFGNVVQGNFIGTDITGGGIFSFRNGSGGVRIENARVCLIGGTNAGAGNLIRNGITINGASTFHNVIQGNRIEESSAGIEFNSHTFSNLIGGLTAGAGNIIALNSTGIRLNASFGTNNSILGNSIFSNADLGIDLAFSGVLANDPGDTDAGVNFQQNFPVLTTASRSTTSTLLQGTLNSHSNSTFRIEFFVNDDCDSSGFGEGQTFLLATNLTTDGSGNASFNLTLSLLPLGKFITATATDASGNTSEFCACAPVVPSDSVNLGVSVTNSTNSARTGLPLTYTITVTNRGPGTATGIVVTNRFSVGTTINTMTPSQGTCTDLGGDVVRCNLGTITNGGFATIALQVSHTTAGTNQLTANAIATEADNNVSNNVASVTSRVGFADVGVVSNVGLPDPVVAGQTVTYTVVVTNAGPDAATSVVLSNNVGLAPRKITASASQGACTVSNTSVVCSLGSIAAGNTATATVSCIYLFATTETFRSNTRAIEQDTVAANNNRNETTVVQSGPGIILMAPFHFAVEGAGTAAIILFRQGGATGVVSVTLSTANGTALAGTDYTGGSQAVQFTNGQTLAFANIPLINDSVQECNETVLLNLSNPTGGVILAEPTNAVLTITDDDLSRRAPVELVSAHAPGLFGASGTLFPTVSLSGDGRYVAYQSSERDVLPGVTNGSEQIFLYDRVTKRTTLVSAAPDGVTPADRDCDEAHVSLDGRFVLFFSSASNLVAGATNGVEQLYLRDLQAGVTRLVSLSTNGVSGADDDSFEPVMSADARFISFYTSASNLVAGAASGATQVYLRDMQTNRLTLVSRNMAGTGGGNFDSSRPALSRDGRFIAFESDATDVLSGDNNQSTDIFLFDRNNGSIVLASLNSAGTGVANSNSFIARVSDNGRFVMFQSEASDLVSGDANNAEDVIVRDLLLGTNILVSVNTVGTGTGNNDSSAAVMTPDGRFVAFESRAANLVTNINTASLRDVYWRDLQGGVTKLVSVTEFGRGGSSASFDALISDNGRYVYFETSAEDIFSGLQDENGDDDLFVRDTTSNVTLAVSVKADGISLAGQDSFSSGDYAISTNGLIAVFVSDSDEITSLDANGTSDAFVRDLGAERTELVTLSIGQTGGSKSELPRLSADGRFVAFQSIASNFAPGDTNESPDVFVRDLQTGAIVLASVNVASNGPGNNESRNASISADGRRIAFETFAGNLFLNDSNEFILHVVMRDLVANTTVAVDLNAAGEQADTGSRLPVISPDGRWVAFESGARNLAPNDTNGQLDLFLRDLQNNTTRVVSVNTNGVASGGFFAGYDPLWSANGRFVFFRTFQKDLSPQEMPANSNTPELYLHDVVANTNRPVTVSMNGLTTGITNQSVVSASADGRLVTFDSPLPTFIPGDANNASDVFVRDTVGGSNILVSVAADGGFANAASTAPAISGNGRFVAFISRASNLAPLAKNGLAQIFVRDLQTRTTTLITRSCDGFSAGDTNSSTVRISADGRYVVFTSQAGNLIGGAFSQLRQQVFIHDRQTSETRVVSMNVAGNGGGNNASRSPIITPDAAVIVFESDATDFGIPDFNTETDIYVSRIPIGPVADIAIMMNASPNSVSVGGSVTLTIGVTNIGAVGATGVSLTSTLPAGLSLTSSSTTQGSCTNTGNTVTCSIGSFAPGAGAGVTVTVTATVAGNPNVTASASSSPSDANSANNSASATVTVSGATRPRLVSVFLSGTNFNFSFQTEAGKSYTVEFNDDLGTTNWSPLQTIGGDGSLRQVVTPVLNVPQRFFRVRHP